MRRETATQGPLKVTATGPVVIKRSSEAVWDFTQDYQRRKIWELATLTRREMYRAKQLLEMEAR